MALMKSLNSGVSGLRSFQTKIDVIGNNISNVETTGFKGSRVNFTEMFNQRLGSTGGSSSAPQVSNHIGLGVRVSSITRDFEQGSINSTSAPTDLAIEGDGFFMVNDQTQQFLTRAGNFGFNNEGYLVTQAGYNVQGFNADATGNILAGGATESLRVDFESVSPPKVTENAYIAGNLDADTSVAQVVQAQSSFTDETTGDLADSTTDINDLSQTTTDLVAGDTIDFDMTLNDGSTTTVTFTYGADGTTLGDLATTINNNIGTAGTGHGSASIVDGLMILRSLQIGSSQFNVDNVTVTGTGDVSFPGFSVTQEGETGSKTVSSTIYDSLGRAHTLMMEFTQTDVNTWDYQARFLDGEAITAGGTGTLTFNDQGKLTSGSQINITFDPGNGAGNVPFTVNLGDPEAGVDFTQYAGSSTAKAVSQDGYSQGQLVDYEIDGGGYINGIYDNGQNIQLGQIALANVTNEHGLEPEGNGLFRPTLTSGTVNIDTAENLSGTDIKSGALEGSNVDLAAEFTELMTAQRAYQSNARVITTADDLLTEVVNLKR